MVEQEEMYREMERIMRQLSPNRQRYLLELARASKKAESYLEGPDTLQGLSKEGESFGVPQRP